MRAKGKLWLGLLGIPLLLIAVQSAAAPEKAAVPDWRLQTTDGKEVSFYECLGKGPVIVSFWATWCRPCLQELPHLDVLARQYEGRLTVLAVNADNTRSVAKVRPLVKSKKWSFTVPLDTSGDLQRMLQVGGVIPFMVVYESDGSEVYRHIGYKPGDEVELQKVVAELLGETEAGEDSEGETNKEPAAEGEGDQPAPTAGGDA